MRVDWETMKKAKLEGGMGLISIKGHMVALIAKAMLEIPIDGDSSLQHILRAKIGNLSLRKWGRNDYSWLIDPSRTRPMDDSTFWNAFCNVWIHLHKFVRPSASDNWEAKKSLPLWVPHLMHREREGPMQISREACNLWRGYRNLG